MANQMQPIEPQVKLDLVKQTDYQSGFNSLALTPDIYGQAGAIVATNASIALNKKRGAEAGLNPSGEALPPLTTADKAYVSAYENQAHATLANQANKLILDADEEMAKLNKIGPEDITKYKDTLKDGFSQILSVAPQDAKLSLFNGLNTQLMSSVHTYQNRYINQQKVEEKSNSDLAITNANQGVHEAFMNGEVEKAQGSLNSQLNLIQQGVNGGIYSKAQGEALKKSAVINYQSNALIQEGIAKHAEGKQAEWLESLVDNPNKPENLSWTDWETSINNARQFMANREQFTKQAAQVIASNGYLDIANETMTPAKLQQYQEQLREEPILFNNLAIAFAHQSHKQQRGQSELNFIAANFDNNEVMRTASTANINKAFKQLSNLYQNTHKGIEPEEADFITAASAAVPVPIYNEGLARDIQSGDPGKMQRAIGYYKRLSALPGNKTAPFLNKPETIAMMNNYQTALDTGLTEEEAAATAQEIVNKRRTDPEYANQINSITRKYLSKNANTDEAGYKLVRKQLNLNSNVVVEDKGALVSQWRKLFTAHMQLSDGNSETAQKSTNEAFEKTFGVTNVNGHESYMQYPPEKFIPGGPLAVPLIQLDMHTQIKDAVAFNKKIYDEGHQNYYYEIETPTNLEDYSKAKERLRTQGLKDPDYATDKNLVKKLESGQPLKVTRIFRNKTRQEFQTYLKNNPFQSISVSTGELQGGYDIGLYDPKTGSHDSFFGVFPHGNQKVDYYPNIDWIKKNVMTVNNITSNDPTKESARIKNYLKDAEAIDYRHSLYFTANHLGRVIP